jgi:metallo-beta-lactamase family protein
LYTQEEAKQCLEYFQPVSFGESKQLAGGLSFRFVHAAHILGSCMIEVSVTRNGGAHRLLFTGDLGRVQDTTVAPGKVVHHSPQEGESANLLVMESTYGNRVHPTTDPRPEMARAITATVQRGGSVVVPSFAVERTQKFLFVMKEMIESGQIPRIPVFCDSPMAIKAVQVFLNHQEEYSEETKSLIGRFGSPLEWSGFKFCPKQEDSRKIGESRFPCIIVSANGMCMGGRIQHHLLQRLPDPRNLILFIGFQAPGTRGAQIKNGEKQVKIFGEIVPVRAQVTAQEQFSDHADTPEILKWLRTFSQQPQETWLVHGEPVAAQSLRDSIMSAMHWRVDVAQYMQKVPLA